MSKSRIIIALFIVGVVALFAVIYARQAKTTGVLPVVTHKDVSGKSTDENTPSRDDEVSDGSTSQTLLSKELLVVQPQGVNLLQNSTNGGAHPLHRYTDIVFDSTNSHKDIVYKSTYHTKFLTEGEDYSIDYNLTSPTDLKLNVYEPSGDSLAHRPLLIFVYGGGWIFGDRYQQEEAAIDYARRGYVTMTLDYTMMPPDIAIEPPVPDPDYSVYSWLMYNSSNDIYEAYSWALQHSDVYRIDPDRVGLGGWSAGGVLVNTLGHMNVSPEPTGIKGILGISGVLPAGLVNVPPLSGWRVFDADYHPASMFASYDEDTGYGGTANDHAADCEYLTSIGHDCTTVTFAGPGHLLWFDQPPVQDYAIDFFATHVAGYSL